jgi:hypothetical protein
MTDDQVALLLWIQKSENPNWAFLSSVFPTGYIWDPQIVAKMLQQLRAAGMIQQTDSQTNILILQPGLDAIAQYLKAQESEGEKADLQYKINQLTKEHLLIQTLLSDLQLKHYPTTKKLAEDADKIGRSGLCIAKWSMALAALSVLMTVIIELLKHYKIWFFG